MLVADGLFAFLTEPVIVGIFRRITEHFASGELAFNDYGRIGWVSRLAIKLYPQKMFKDVGSQLGYLGFKDAHHPETWNPRMRLVEEASLTHAPEVDLFPGWIRIATKLSGMSKHGAARRESCATRSEFGLCSESHRQDWTATPGTVAAAARTFEARFAVGDLDAR